MDQRIAGVVMAICESIEPFELFGPTARTDKITSGPGVTIVY
jgi:hypothetical protein